VQGVGFRPWVYALARRYGLSGFVYNDKEGLVVEAQGEAAPLEAFEAALRGTKDTTKDARETTKDTKASTKDTKETTRDTKGTTKDAKASTKDTKGTTKDVKDATRDTTETTRDTKDTTKDTTETTRDTKGATKDTKGTTRDTEGIEGTKALPPLARVDALEVEALPCREEEGFVILPSPPGEAPPLLSVGPDMAPCLACLEEMFSPAERRYLYPFLNCTHCGPRYTACFGLPWDRPNTSLAAFPMCEACATEYENPDDRRFHAQPTACPTCGPALETGLPALTKCIAEGGIAALKAAGGFQLACDARNEAAVERLRLRKQREGKPFAVMVPTLATARRYAVLSEEEEALLQSAQRPIVLVRKRNSREEAASLGGEDESLAASIAPGLACFGLCLPSTPLHHALFYEALGRPSSSAWLDEAHSLAWVMTSGNLGGEPLALHNDEALSKLSGVADTFALHNRPIAARMDDSVLQVVDGAPQFLRRARGFVPRPLPLPWRGPPLLAVGGHLKAAFCLVHDNRAYVSQHLGDMDTPEARSAFGDSVQQLCGLLGLKPALLAADLHPDYFTTQWAEATGLSCLSVQHHAAHVAAVWAEYPEMKGPLLGLALDGVGFGSDGLPWGGELLWLEGGEGSGFHWHRLGHLKPLPLLGGDAAAREPWRMGVAAYLALGEEAKALETGAPHGLSPALLSAWKRGGLKAPLSTSLGRFFDAAASLMGLCETASFEAEAPMRLEALAHRAFAAPWPLEGFHIEENNVLNLLGLLSPLAACRPAAASAPYGGEAATMARWLHEAVALALAEWAAGEARRRKVSQVALGGGCLQNRLLCEALAKQLRQRGLSPLLPRRLPPNDGGLCLGQALAAAWHFG
jgi:hydrogenase maturation protein HypF